MDIKKHRKGVFVIGGKPWDRLGQASPSSFIRLKASPASLHPPFIRRQTHLFVSSNFFLSINNKKTPQGCCFVIGG